MKNFIMSLCVVCSVAMLGMLLSGCESADGYSISVSASKYTVSNGETVSLTASGWDDFTWGLSDQSLGSLSSLNGESVVYTSRTSNSGTQVITVTARGSGVVSTNRVASTNKQDSASAPIAATVEIKHVGVQSSSTSSNKTTGTANDDDPPTP